MPNLDVVIVANSPGELSAQVKPVVQEIKKDPSVRISLILTPCQYTSGSEMDFAKSIEGISQLASADDYKAWILLGRKPAKLEFSRKGVVLYLGGDLAHAMLIARKLKYPAYAYVQDLIAWGNFYRKFFVPDPYTYYKFSKKVNKKKLLVAGNLMVDAVAENKKWEPEENVITFMPGSRKWEIDYMTPLYKDVISFLQEKSKRLKFQVVSSPFSKAQPIDGVKMVSFENAYNSEVVVTIPGTNTAKLAARGIPMVVVFPLNNPEVIPLDGIADWFGKLPVVGKAFKKHLAKQVNQRTKYFALPNQKAQEEIVPEIRGNVTIAKISETVLSLLKDKPKRVIISEKLVDAMGPSGAAKKIWETIRAEL